MFQLDGAPDPDNAGGGKRYFPPGEVIQEVFFMDEQPKEVVEEKKQTFFQKYSFPVKPEKINTGK